MYSSTSQIMHTNHLPKAANMESNHLQLLVNKQCYLLSGSDGISGSQRLNHMKDSIKDFCKVSHSYVMLSVLFSKSRVRDRQSQHLQSHTARNRQVHTGTADTGTNRLTRQSSGRPRFRLTPRTEIENTGSMK